MANFSTIEPFKTDCEDGLILDESILHIHPGAASVLQNFEPDIEDGYRRILGHAAFDTNALTGAGAILGVALRASQVIASRGANVMRSTGAGWTSITTGRTSAGRYKFDTYRWGGAVTIAMADDSGNNPAALWDGSSYTLLNGTGSPTAPHDVVEFQQHLFFAEDNVITFCAPFAETDFTPASGAGSFIIPSDAGTIIKMKVRRNKLYIFGQNQIYYIVGSSIVDFDLQPVTKNIGCVDGWSVQEFAGDVIFLAPDGLRTISGTENEDDTTAISTISKPIQKLLKGLHQDNFTISSCVVRDKSQYRIWYNQTADAVANATGVIATWKRNRRSGGMQWEFSEMIGIKPGAAVSGILTGGTGTEVILHGDLTDGKIYQQEQTNTFAGTTIIAKYRTPDIIIEDQFLIKNLHRIILNLDRLGTFDVNMKIIYDLGSTDTPQPIPWTLQAVSSSSTYGTGVYGTSTYNVAGQVWIRQAIEGSGFIIAIEFTENSGSSAFSIKGFQLEYDEGGRRGN